MRCANCGVTKLSREFPLDTITAKCQHPALTCLKCTICHVKEYGECPDAVCKEKVTAEHEKIKLYEAILDSLFSDTVEDVPILTGISGDDTIIISLMNGDRQEVPFSPDMTVLQLKEYIYQHFGHDRNKQRLLYKGTDLKTLKPGRLATLSDYGVVPRATVHLLVVLYTIPDDLNHVVFDLYWGIPPGIRCDFLDASCFVYEEDGCIDVIDYVTEESTRVGKAVSHTGDEVDRARKVGHHRIEVRLKDLPQRVTHLFFTLSAWDSSSISRFITSSLAPSLRVFDAENIFRDLCQKSFSDSASQQAVVVCCVYRVQDRWTIFESGYETAGNTDNYKPIKTAIEEHVKTMCI